MMTLTDIHDAANRLRSLQQRALSTMHDQRREWQREMVAIRSEIAREIETLASAVRNWSPPDSLAAEYKSLVSNVGRVRAALAMHQALWPAVAIDPRDPQFQSSVRQIRTAYDELFANLDRVSGKRALPENTRNPA